MNVTEATQAVMDLLEAANAGTVKVWPFLGEPSPPKDADGRAHAYHALFPDPGLRDPRDRKLTGEDGARTVRFQLICAGGDVTRALRAVERAHSVLIGTRLDETTGLIREDGDGGPIRKDETVTPSRQFAPLLLAVDL